MAELLLELYSEEIPPQLQIGARTQLKEFIESSFKENEIKYKELIVYSSPTRLVLLADNIVENIKVAAKEIKGPKVGSPDQVIQGFAKAKNVSKQDLIEKDTDKGKFYFIKTQPKSILVEELLRKIIPKAISSISWKKSMKWSDHNLMWGRPLQSIFARFNNKKLSFSFEHLETTDEIIVEQDLSIKSKKINNFKEYLSFLKSFNIIVDHKLERKLFSKRLVLFQILNSTKIELTKTC